jgi:hypothetical protein
VSRAALGRCTCREDGEECARCRRLIAQHEERGDEPTSDEWDRLEAGVLANSYPGQPGL